MQQHDVDNTTTRKSDHDKARPPNTPDAQEAEDGIQKQIVTPETNTQGLGEQIRSSIEQHKGVHRDTLDQPQNTNSLIDTGDKATRGLQRSCCQSSFQGRD